jgi:hypothetical protein
LLAGLEQGWVTDALTSIALKARQIVPPIVLRKAPEFIRAVTDLSFDVQPSEDLH